MPSSIFKAYDIRGIADEEIDAGVARRLGKVLSELYDLKHVLIGRDMRKSSPSLENALVDGLRTSGVDVTLIGQCSTPVFNVTLGDAAGAYDLGIMVTASHNPAEYNGFKITKGDCIPVGKGNGMEEIEARFHSEESLFDHAKRGQITEDKEAIDRYIKKIIAIAALPSIKKPLRFVMDAGNGMNGIVTPKLLRQIKGVEFIGLFLEPDGTFPNHEANPLKTETLKDAQKAIQKYEADFGVAFDGDGDRVGFIDEKGIPIPGDIQTALFSILELEKNPEGKILYDIRSSWAVPETIGKFGGEAIMCRVGHANIKKQMREEQAIFAGELSEHFYFHETYNCEATDLALLLMIKLLNQKGQTLSSIWKPLQKYAHSEEKNYTVKEPESVIEALDKRYAEHASSRSDLDGIRLEFRDPTNPEQDWWFNVRASNTEPLLRLNLEAKTSDLMQQHIKELETFIEQYG